MGGGRGRFCKRTASKILYWNWCHSSVQIILNLVHKLDIEDVRIACQWSVDAIIYHHWQVNLLLHMCKRWTDCSLTWLTIPLAALVELSATNPSNAIKQLIWLRMVNSQTFHTSSFHSSSLFIQEVPRSKFTFASASAGCLAGSWKIHNFSSCLFKVQVNLSIFYFHDLLADEKLLLMRKL